VVGHLEERRPLQRRSSLLLLLWKRKDFEECLARELLSVRLRFIRRDGVDDEFRHAFLRLKDTGHILGRLQVVHIVHALGGKVGDDRLDFLGKAVDDVDWPAAEAEAQCEDGRASGPAAADDQPDAV
jgi:hypothetical protein